MGKSEDQDFQPLTQFLMFKLLMTNITKSNHVVTNITKLLDHLVPKLPKLNHLVTNIPKLNNLVRNITITNLAPPRPMAQVLQPLLPPISRSNILCKTWLALKKCPGLLDHLR